MFMTVNGLLFIGMIIRNYWLLPVFMVQTFHMRTQLILVVVS